MNQNYKASKVFFTACENIHSLEGVDQYQQATLIAVTKSHLGQIEHLGRRQLPRLKNLLLHENEISDLTGLET